MIKNLKTSRKLLVLLLLSGMAIFAGCQKSQIIEDSNLAGSKLETKSMNMLNLTTGQVTLLRNTYVEEQKNYQNQYGSIKSFASAIADNNSNSQNPTYKQLLNEVMKDNFISSILNDDGEITVDGNLYKVTVFGTFKSKPENKANIDAILKILYSKYDVKKINIDKPSFDLTSLYSNGAASIKKVSSSKGYVNANECPEIDYVDLINEVDYYPTFTNEELEACDIPGGGGGGGGYTPDPTPQVFNNDHPMFLPGNMTTQNMVNPNGSFWSTIFENSTLYNDFDSEYRTSVLFYNRNYGFIKTLGIKVKHQKSGWFWYNSTNTNVVSAGWESIVYETINADPTKKYYPTVIPASNNQYATDVLPNNIQIMRTFNAGQAFYYPLIVANGLPIPNPYDSMGPKGIAKFIWDLIKKKINEKSGDAGWGGIPVVDESGTIVNYIYTVQQSEALKQAAIIAEIQHKGELQLVLPAHQQNAFNTDMIDIPLDDYYSDIQTLGVLITLTAVSPGVGGAPLFAFTKDEFSKSFKVIHANIYGSSSRNGMWRGVRVTHN